MVPEKNGSSPECFHVCNREFVLFRVGSLRGNGDPKNQWRTAALVPAYAPVVVLAMVVMPLPAATQAPTSLHRS
eukprot:727127-Amphidinium_carterae.1